MPPRPNRLFLPTLAMLTVAGLLMSPGPAGAQCILDGICQSAYESCDCVPDCNGLACDDWNACTNNDRCQGGTCMGDEIGCPAPGPCQNAGICNPATGDCSYLPKPDGTACSDGNNCTDSETCNAGSCTGTPVVCTALDECHDPGTCNPATGVCSNPAKPDGTGCNDGKKCTKLDECTAGVCAGENVVCTALDQCHDAGTCNPGTGACSHPSKPDGTPCDDGNASTVNDQCTAGACAGTIPSASDFYVRDWTNSAADHDTGAQPSTDWTYWDRCDVWTRQTNTPGTFPSDQPENEDAIAGGTNYAFTRVHRNATGAAETVTAEFFFYNLGVGSNWVQQGADETLSFAAGDTVIVSPGHLWSPPLGTSGKKCLGVQISTPSDPYMLPDMDGSGFGGIMEDNNKAQRNIWVVPLPAPAPGPSPTPLPGGAGFHFIVHNPSVFKRTMVLEFSVGKDALEQLVNPRVEVVEGKGVPLGPRGTLSLPEMQPGENRWVRVVVDAVRGKRPVAISFSPAKAFRRDRVEGGVTIVLKPTDLRAVMDQNLRLHEAVFTRIDAILKRGETPRRPLDRPVLLEKPIDAPMYRRHLDRSLKVAPELLDSILKKGATDPFRVRETLASLRALLASQDDVTLAMAHLVWLDQLDACLTRLQLADGDPADIAQNVRWQLALLYRIGPLGKKPHGMRVAEQSAEFLRGFSKGSVTAKDYPKYIEQILPGLRALAADAPQLKLAGEPDGLGQGRGSLAALQKAHRALLLRLQELEVPRKP